MRVLGAIRLSHETDETTSPERQRAGLTAWAASLGHTIVGWAEDLDVSGSVPPPERPNLGRWLGDSPPVAFDIIAATKIDRLSRDLGDFVDLIEWASAQGKHIVAYMDSVDTSTPTGELVAKVLAIFAEFERKAIALRNADSQALAMKEGRYHGGTPPYGYKVAKHQSGKGFVLVPDEKAVAILDEIIAWCHQSEAMTAICAYLSDRGVPTPNDHFRLSRDKEPKGTRWSVTALRDMLRSKALRGIRVTKDGQVIYGEDGLPMQRAEPVVSQADFEFLQRYLAGQARAPRRTRNTSPLLGIVFCLKCGRPAYRTTTKTGEYYRCSARIARNPACSAVSFRSTTIPEVIENNFLKHIGGLEVLQEVFIPGESHSEALRDAEAAWNDLQERSAGKPKAVQDLYMSKIAALEELIVKLSALPEVPSRIEWRATGQTYREVWDQTDEQGKRKLLLDAGVRLETAVVDGPWVSVGRFERPTRYDEAVSLGITKDIQYAFYIPRDLAARTTRLPRV